jgi:hypothetical protein
MPTLAGTITASVLPALGALSAALLPIAAIAYHKQIAGAIDSAHPEISDWLMNSRDWLRGDFRNTGSAVPPSGGKNVTVNTAVNLDGRQIANVTTQHQASAAAGPLTSGSGFDGRLSPIWGGF